MLTLLPFLALGLLVPLSRTVTGSWRSAALAGSIVWGVLIAAMTEGLSLIQALTANALGMCWGGVILALVALSRLWQQPSETHAASGLNSFSLFGRVLVGCVALISVVLFGVALIAPPSSWDSIVYHMPRVEHWIQNRSVAHYSTHVLRELHRNPWAEFAILHLQSLSGSDRFANLVQWLSMVGSLVAVSLIARELGADIRGQVLAVIVAAALPVGILQATTTLNDYAGAYWVICLVYFLMVLVKTSANERKHTFVSILAGASLGLALLTKATSYLQVFPFLLWYAVVGARVGIGSTLRSLVILAVLSASLNAGYLGRNLQLFGTLFGPAGSEECEKCVLTNDAMSPSLFVSNVLRNVAMHVRLPSQAVDNAVTDVIGSAHQLLKVDATDSRTTWREHSFYLVPPRFDENTEGNPVHLLLMIWSIGFVLLRWRALSPLTKQYAVLLVSAFILFCLVIKWGPHNVRYHLGYFVLWAPLIGIALGACRLPFFAAFTAAALVALAVPWLVFNIYKPLVAERNIFNTPREAQFFLAPTVEWTEAINNFRGAADFVASSACREVGIIRSPDDAVYPFWVILRNRVGESVRIEDVQVGNESRRALGDPGMLGFEPCANVTIREGSLMAVMRKPLRSPEAGATAPQPGVLGRE